MKMQDNEFDGLFSSKLENFETDPSIAVWQKIDNELNAGKRKKTLTPILSIAASVILLLIAWVLFIPTKINLKPGKHPADNGIVKVTPTFNSPPVARDYPNKNSVKPKSLNKINETLAVANRMTGANAIKPTKHTIAIIRNKTPNNTADQALLVSQPQTQQNIIKAVVPDERTQIAINPHVEETTNFITKPALVAEEIPLINKQDILPLKSKHRIHNLGDLINVVVAKVDKRKDKIIEFTDTDDDESTITGVNLGIIKIKKSQ